MSSFILTVIWRRKIVFLVTALVFVLGIWVYALYNSNYTNDIQEKTRSALNKGFEDQNNRIFGELQLHSTDSNDIKLANDFYHTTRHKDHLKNLNSFPFNDNKAEKMLQNMIVPDDENDQESKNSEHLHIAAENQRHYEHELQNMNIPIIAGLGPGGHPPPTERLVHFDLKGAPPKISYLKRLLPIIKSLGGTGLLLEYEDMFPYKNTISEITATNAYTKNEIKDLLHTAATLGLSVMPLVQTFGHVEFILKLKEFQHLREVEESPQSLCPSLNDSMIFIEEMISQIIELHMPTTQSPILSSSVAAAASGSNIPDDNIELLTPNFTHLHIGCDEVNRMGECPRCRNRLRDDIFVSHVTAIAQMVKKRWPHLKLVIWDDMLRHVQQAELEESKIGELVEPMVWVYAEDIYHFVPSQIFDKYSKVFPTLWTASAFKGAHGETLMVPPTRRHLENNLRWLAVIQGESAKFSNGIQGLVLTGWQRYDHFAVLCELLPTAIPSLAICLSAAAKGYFDVNPSENPFLSAMTCPDASESFRHPWIEFNRDQELYLFSKCMFPGSSIFRFVLRLISVTTETAQYLDNIRTKRGWMTDYNIKHNFSAPLRIEELMAEASRYTYALENLSRDAETNMEEVFDKWTINEYIEQHVTPLMDDLRKLEEHARNLLSIKVWPRRPLPYIKGKGINTLLHQENTKK